MGEKARLEYESGTLIDPDCDDLFVDYILGSGAHCPKCQSKNISTFGEMQVNIGCATQYVKCYDCQFVWVDEYNLTGAHTCD